MADLFPKSRLVRKRNLNLEKQLEVRLQILTQEYRQTRKHIAQCQRDCGYFLYSLHRTAPGLHAYLQPDTRAMYSNTLLRERRYSLSSRCGHTWDHSEPRAASLGYLTFTESSQPAGSAALLSDATACVPRHHQTGAADDDLEKNSDVKKADSATCLSRPDDRVRKVSIISDKPGPSKRSPASADGRPGSSKVHPTLPARRGWVHVQPGTSVTRVAETQVHRRREPGAHQETATTYSRNACTACEEMLRNKIIRRFEVIFDPYTRSTTKVDLTEPQPPGVRQQHNENADLTHPGARPLRPQTADVTATYSKLLGTHSHGITPSSDQSIQGLRPHTAVVASSSTKDLRPHTAVVASSSTQDLRPHTAVVASSSTQDLRPHTAVVASSSTQGLRPHTAVVASGSTQDLRPHTAVVAPSSTRGLSPHTAVVAPSSTRGLRPHTAVVAPSSTRGLRPHTAVVASSSTRGLRPHTAVVASSSTQGLRPHEGHITPGYAKIARTTRPSLGQSVNAVASTEILCNLKSFPDEYTHTPQNVLPAESPISISIVPPVFHSAPDLPLTSHAAPDVPSVSHPSDAPLIFHPPPDVPLTCHTDPDVPPVPPVVQEVPPVSRIAHDVSPVSPPAHNVPLVSPPAHNVPLVSPPAHNVPPVSHVAHDVPPVSHVAPEVPLASHPAPDVVPMSDSALDLPLISQTSTDVPQTSYTGVDVCRTAYASLQVESSPRTHSPEMANKIVLQNMSNTTDSLYQARAHTKNNPTTSTFNMQASAKQAPYIASTSHPISPHHNLSTTWVFSVCKCQFKSLGPSTTARHSTTPKQLVSKLLFSGRKDIFRSRPKTAPPKYELTHRSLPASRQTVAGILAQIENHKAEIRAKVKMSKNLRNIVKKLVPCEQGSLN